MSFGYFEMDLGGGEGENVFVVSRLDLIYKGVSLKDASIYFEVADGKLVAGAAKK